MRYKESKIYDFTTPKMCDQKVNQKNLTKNSFQVKI